MTTFPFFSVVIPAYNCADFLRRSLSSVLTQTCQDFEIIVVDNSSADDTGRVVESFDDDRLRSVEVQNHGIIAYSRNVGIELAQGEWVAFLDADDRWLPEKLETVREAILRDRDVILVSHNEWLVVDGARKRRLRHFPALANVYENLLFKGNCLSTSAVTVRKDMAIKSGGFSEKRDFMTAEDYEYWIRLAGLGPFCFLEKTMGEFHVHGGNISGKAEVHAKACVRVAEYHLHLWSQEHPDRQNRVKRGKGRIWAGASHLLLLGHQFSMSNQYARRAISLDPSNWKAWSLLVLSITRIAI